MKSRPLNHKDAHLAPCQAWVSLYLLDILSNSATPLVAIAAATACPLPGHHTSHLNPTAHLPPSRNLRIRSVLGIDLPNHQGRMMNTLVLQEVPCLCLALPAISPCPQDTLSQQGVVPAQGQCHLIYLHHHCLSCSLVLHRVHLHGLGLTATPLKPLGNSSLSQVMPMNIQKRKNP